MRHSREILLDPPDTVEQRPWLALEQIHKADKANGGKNDPCQYFEIRDVFGRNHISSCKDIKRNFFLGQRPALFLFVEKWTGVDLRCSNFEKYGLISLA